MLRSVLDVYKRQVRMGDFGKVNSLKAPNKTLALVFLTMALVYNVIFGFIRNPAGTDNTLSLIHIFPGTEWQSNMSLRPSSSLHSTPGSVLSLPFSLQSQRSPEFLVFQKTPDL